jgi:hypothetical protein
MNELRFVFSTLSLLKIIIMLFIRYDPREQVLNVPIACL